MKTILKKLVEVNNLLQDVEIKGSNNIMALGNAIMYLQQSIDLLNTEILNQEKPQNKEN